MPASANVPNRKGTSLTRKSEPAPDEKYPVAMVSALTLAGFALRFACAGGDLWLDEIWSLQNLAPLHRLDEIFYAISQDNNHFLNSLWLFLVGPQAPAQIIRLASIVFGSLTIPVAAKLALRAGRPAALAAAALVAFAIVFVHYGSEARGYAGFLLMLFCAAETLENHVADPQSHRPRIAFALCVAIGALFHVAMVEATAILICATLARIALATRSLGAIGRAARDLAVAAVLGVLPVFICIVAGLLYTHKLQFGVQVPFSFGGFVYGLTTLFGMTLGFTRDFSTGLAGVAGLVWIVLALAVIRAEQRILPAAAILLPSLLAIVAQLPNVQIPRFHLIAVIGLVLLFAEVTAYFWRQHRRFFALAMAFVVFAGNAGALAELITRGRGDYRSMIFAMETDGAGTYASNMPAEVTRIIRFYDAELGGNLAPATETEWCNGPPRWYILVDDAADEALTRTFGPPACTTSFTLRQVMLPAALSGLRLALYRRIGE